MPTHQRLVSILQRIRQDVATHLDKEAINAVCRQEKYTWKDRLLNADFRGGKIINLFGRQGADFARDFRVLSAQGLILFPATNGLYRALVASAD